MTTNHCELSLTQAALTHIEHFLEKNSLYALRIRVEQRGCSGFEYVIDEIKHSTEIKASDITKAFSSTVTIYVAEASVNYINGLVIDFAKAKGDEHNPLKSATLIFINPNEKGRCGCGESFNV